MTDCEKLKLEPPETLRCGDNHYRCGGTVYRAVAHAVGAKKGGTTVRQLAVAVWGRTVGPEVGRVTIKGVIHRVNDVLAGIGARERLTLDGDAVLLV